MKILLTNDDSLDSPLFHFAVDYFQAMGDVTVVVPMEEQSWKGKAMTRFGKLHARPLEDYDCPAFAFSGTPADCANFGIYEACETRPDLVISGINMGSNVGLGFTVSSGTVGAALEANLAGIPAVALSQVLPSKVFQHWGTHREFLPDAQAAMFVSMQKMVEKVFVFLNAQDDFMSEPVTWNVNMPAEPAKDWQVVQTVLGHTVYGGCFKAEGDGFLHNIDRPAVDETEGSDGMTVAAGHVSVTRLDLRILGR